MFAEPVVAEPHPLWVLIPTWHRFLRNTLFAEHTGAYDWYVRVPGAVAHVCGALVRMGLFSMVLREWCISLPFPLPSSCHLHPLDSRIKMSVLFLHRVFFYSRLVIFCIHSTVDAYVLAIVLAKKRNHVFKSWQGKLIVHFFPFWQYRAKYKLLAQSCQKCVWLPKFKCLVCLPRVPTWTLPKVC